MTENPLSSSDERDYKGQNIKDTNTQTRVTDVSCWSEIQQMRANVFMRILPHSPSPGKEFTGRRFDISGMVWESEERNKKGLLMQF